MFVRSCLFLARRRVLAVLLIMGLTLPAALWAQHASFSSRLSDYYPSQHPHIRLYQDFTEMLKMTNAVILTVTVREGTIFSSVALGKVHRLTVGLLETKGVNPYEVMSLTHPRLKDIKVSSEGINILPVVQHPEQPQAPEELARIKNAVYTNLGIRSVYVSSDEKTALIRAGFWDGGAEPRDILTRLQTLAEKERDANTDIAFTGNLVLAAWLIDAAPRSLLLLLVSAGVALFLAGQMAGFVGGALAAALVNLSGALWGFGLLGVLGLALEPLAIIALFPLCIRGLALTLHWRSFLAAVHAETVSPFAQTANRDQALKRTAETLGRPLMLALVTDAAALFLLTWSDVPALQALGYLSLGWIVGLLVALWTILPVWSTLGALRGSTGAPSLGSRLATQIALFFGAVLRRPATIYAGIVAVAFLGLGAVVQLQAGRAMLGTTLFYDSHPFNHAFSIVNGKFIGVNQLIVLAHAPGEAAFRDPKALEALEIFQHDMAEERQFGGALTITNLAKSITRMFHEDVPKWEMIPDDIDSTGQVIFRIISSAATPSEVERFLSTDFRTTAVTFFYREYSPALLDRIMERTQAFSARHQNGVVQFRVGGGILGVLAAVHSAVEHALWQTAGMLPLVLICGGLFVRKSFRVVRQLLIGLLLAEGILLGTLWLGGIDLNMYTLPAIVLSFGVVLIPAFLAFSPAMTTPLHAVGCVATGLTVASAAVAWLFSPLRLQAEIGAFFIVLALLFTVIVLGLRNRFAADDV